MFHEILCTAAFGTITYADMIVAEEKYNYDNDFELLNGNKSQASHLRFHQDFIQDGDTWTINHNVGWNYFCDLLANNDKGYFTGKTVKLGADIGTAENPVIRMAGETHHDFTGTFDGDGHKLTFNYNGIADGVAPFLYVDGCTIENLHVDGSITNFGTRAAGIVARQNGEVTIRNCRSSVIIKSDNIKKGYHGGLVSKIENYAMLNIVGFGFFEYTGANLPAQKAFLAIDETNLEALARGLTMTFGDDATGIHEITDPTPGPSPAWEGSSAWFTLDGRKLGTKPTQKGVYIYKGKKRVIE